MMKRKVNSKKKISNSVLFKNSKQIFAMVLLFFTFMLFNYTPNFALKSDSPKTNNSKDSNGTEIASENKRNNISQAKISSDTSDVQLKIVQIYTDKEKVIIKIDVRNYDSEIRISAFNMLGKEVKEFFKGTLARQETTLDFPIGELPNGLYLCIIQGRDLKLAEKFIISR